MLALRQKVAEAEAAGYRMLIMGDLNARIGQACELPLEEHNVMQSAEPSLPAMDNDKCIVGIPMNRVGMDNGTHSVKYREKELLEFPRSSGLVVLNGRAPVDEVGHITCKGDEEAASSIDLVCVSAALYSKVQRMKVHPIEGHKQHAYVIVTILLDKEATCLLTNCGWNANRIRVCRPVLTYRGFTGVADQFMTECEDESELLGGELKAGRADPANALARIAEVIKFCVVKAHKKCRIAPKKDGWGVHKGEKPQASTYV